MKGIIGRAMVVRMLAASLSTSSPENSTIDYNDTPKVVREDMAENI